MKFLLVLMFLCGNITTVISPHPLQESGKYFEENGRWSLNSAENTEDNFQLFESDGIVSENYRNLASEETQEKDVLSLITSAIDLYLPTHTSSRKCLSALAELQKPENVQFTSRMVDSWGKFPDGIYTGNYKPPGIYEECLQLSNDSLKGKYCYVHIRENSTGNATSYDQSIFIFVDLYSLADSFSYGTCMPESCTEADLTESLNVVLNSTHYSELSCSSADDREPFTAGDISFIAFLSIMGLILLMSTAIDLYSTSRGRTSISKSSLEKIKAFSIPNNMKKIFDVTTSAPRGTITCLHGIRTISMAWVIYAHQYLYSLQFTSNINDVPDKSNNFLFQVIMDGYFSVDSFFFLSGLLVGYLTFKYMSKNNGKINLLQYYVHRYLRLTPAIALTAWFQATIARFFVHGPYEDNYKMFTENCRKKWWKDVLYVNNFAETRAEQGRGDCIPQAWYAAADTQIFIFMPLVLIPLYRYRVWGKVFLGFMTLISCIIPGSLTVALDLPPFERVGLDHESQTIYWRYLYVAPFSRASPYLIGIGVGYFIYARGDKTLKLKPWHVVIGWILSIVMTTTLVFGVWKYNLFVGAKTEYSFIFQFFYGGFARALWGLCLAWIVIACHYGYGGPANWFLSHPIFQPFSKLTYTMYILGLGIQMMIMFSRKQPYYFNHVYKIEEVCGALFIIFISATIVSILVEFPIANLERELLRKPVSDKPKNIPTEHIVNESTVEKVNDVATIHEVKQRFQQYP